QDEITLLPDRLKLTLGSKFENNEITGFEVEPSGRLLWKPSERQSVWVSISRAVRTPSWSDLHSTANLLVIPPVPPLSPLPVQVSSLGNPSLESETLTAYELGYRIEPAKHLSLDLAGFYNDYDQLIAPTAVTTGFVASPLPHALIATTDENAGPGHTYGVEASAHWDVTDCWHLTANYSWLGVQLDFNSTYLQSAPEQQAQLRSELDLPYHLELNGAVSFMDQVTVPYGVGQMNIPSYVRLDLGLVWHATKNLELGVWGQNLAQDRHEEFTSYKTMLVTEIPSSVVGRITLHF
ncbi:MAG: TonB-dependent receptor, partial [Verrucomicrobiota bacterium]